LGGAAEVGGHAVRGLDRGVAGRSTILMLPPHARDVLHHELLFNYPIAFSSALFISNVFFFYARHRAASRDLEKYVD
jgi:hypothetical protein